MTMYAAMFMVVYRVVCMYGVIGFDWRHTHRVRAGVGNACS